MRALLTDLKNCWLAPRDASPGIAGFGGVKFYAALICYLAAFLVLAYDPFFRVYGAFSYKQGTVALVLGYLVIAALNWEFLLFGKPAGANLLLQLLQMPPFALLCARLLAKPSQPLVASDWLSSVKQFLTGTAALLFEWMPGWLRDIFANWQISLLLVLILLVFCFRSPALKVGALVFTFFYMIAVNLENQGSWHLVLGVVLLCLGWSLQFCFYAKVIFFENVLKELRSTPECEEVLARTVCRIMGRLYQSGRISEEAVTRLVRSEYAVLNHYSGQELKIMAGEVTRAMLYEYQLAELRCDRDGMFLYADEKLMRYDGLLAWVSIVPRVGVIGLLMILWVASPIDLIPDAVPVVGVLDDVTVAMLSMTAIKNSLRGLKKEK